MAVGTEGNCWRLEGTDGGGGRATAAANQRAPYGEGSHADACAKVLTADPPCQAYAFNCLP